MAAKSDKYISPLAVHFVRVEDNGLLTTLEPQTAVFGDDLFVNPAPAYGRRGGGKTQKPTKGKAVIPRNIAVIKIEGRGKHFYLVKGDESSMAAQSIYLGEPYRMVTPSEFESAALSLLRTGQGSGMIGTARTMQQHVPEMQFIPPRLIDVVLDPENQNIAFGESLAAMLWKFDLREFGTLYQSGTPLEASEMSKWVDPDSILHLRKQWFAFKSVDDAVMLKVLRKDTSHIFPFE